MTHSELFEATQRVLSPTSAGGAAAFFEVPRRRLGRTGAEVSSLGLDTTRLLESAGNHPPRLLRRALEGGVSLLRVSAEQGAALAPVKDALRDGWRDKVLLAARLGPVDGAAVDARIDEALASLGTDCLDLLDLDAGSARPQVFAALLAAQAAGKVRLFGLSGGPSPAAILAGVEAGAAHGLRFDASGLPLDLLGLHRDVVERRVLPPLLQQEVALLGAIPVESTTVTFAERLRYTLSLPVSAVLLELTTEAQLQHALRTARSFKPYTVKELQALLARATLSTRGGPRGGVFHPAGSVPG